MVVWGSGPGGCGGDDVEGGYTQPGGGGHDLYRRDGHDRGGGRERVELLLPTSLQHKTGGRILAFKHYVNTGSWTKTTLFIKKATIIIDKDDFIN